MGIASIKCVTSYKYANKSDFI